MNADYCWLKYIFSEKPLCWVQFYKYLEKNLVQEHFGISSALCFYITKAWNSYLLQISDTDILDFSEKDKVIELVFYKIISPVINLIKNDLVTNYFLNSLEIPSVRSLFKKGKKSKPVETLNCFSNIVDKFL